MPRYTFAFIMKTFLISLAITFAALTSTAQIEVSRPPKSSRVSVMSVPKTIRIAPPPSSKNADFFSAAYDFC